MTDLAKHAELFGRYHDEVVMAETQAQMQTLGDRLTRLPFDATRDRERSGAAMLGVLRAGRGAAERSGLTVAVESFRALPSPAFSLESSQSETSTRYSRADSQAGTLQVRARTGFWEVEYPGQDGFLMPFNTSTAWIGAVIPIPPHGSTTHSTRSLLDVSAELNIEQIWEHSPVAPGSGRDLVLVSPGDGDRLPLRGNAVAWCRTGLTLYSEGGARSRRSTEIVSAWVNRDGSDLDDHAPTGALSLRHVVAISRDLQVAGVFVDITCLAAAEIPEDPLKVLSAYADLKCRSGDDAPVPSQVRVSQEHLRINLCEVPELAPELDFAAAG